MGRGERGNEVEDKIKQPGAFFFWFLREQRGPAGGGAGGGVPRQGNCPGSRSSFFFSSRRRHWRFKCDWSSDVCSSDLSGSRHTLLHIDSEEKLIEAFKIAKQICPAAVIEEELVGPVYRATVVNGKLAATLRRDQQIGRASCRERV